MYEANLGGVFRLYRAALPRCWFPALVLALSGAASAVLLERMVPLPATNDLWQWAEQVRSLMMAPSVWWLLFFAAAISLLCYGALTAVIHAVAEPGAPAPGADGFGPALRTLPGALAAAVIFLVVTTLGTMAFLVPGAYIWGMWQLWLVALVVERLGPVAALGRSWQLMTGAWWRITTFLTVVLIVIMVLAVMAYVFLGGALLVAGAGLAHASGVMMVVDSVIQFLMAPLITAAFVVAYLDRLRNRVVPA